MSEDDGIKLFIGFCLGLIGLLIIGSIISYLITPQTFTFGAFGSVIISPAMFILVIIGLIVAIVFLIVLYILLDKIGLIN